MGSPENQFDKQKIQAEINKAIVEAKEQIKNGAKGEMWALASEVAEKNLGKHEGASTLNQLVYLRAGKLYKVDDELEARFEKGGGGNEKVGKGERGDKSVQVRPERSEIAKKSYTLPEYDPKYDPRREERYTKLVKSYETVLEGQKERLDNIITLNKDEYARLQNFFLRGEGRNISTIDTAKILAHSVGRVVTETRIPEEGSEERKEILKIVDDTANAYGINPEDFRALAYTESKFDRFAVSGSACTGLFQLNRRNSVGQGADNLNGRLNSFDALANAQQAAALFKENKESLSRNLKVSGDILTELTVVAHNVGVEKVIDAYRDGNWKKLLGAGYAKSGQRSYIEMFKNSKNILRSGNW
ncbi:MAG: lytic transglycosylase domain-containing protein [Candidatus Peregrinibacteria bacterium]|nr:lytic transglycosylase domain-containing protein [Candidatus Peregrinibacteria bacterium]